MLLFNLVASFRAKFNSEECKLIFIIGFALSLALFIKFYHGQNISPNTQNVLVEIHGAVHFPGKYTLQKDFKLIDLLNQAKPLNKANMNGINLAKKLVHGSKYEIPYQENHENN